MSKRLILIGGPMGIGKSTLGQYLVDHSADRAVFLDGDWCWAMHPWDFSDENKKMVMANIQFLLNAFIANSRLDTIVFVWVMHQQAIIDELLAGLHGDFDAHSVSLVATPAELTRRFEQDVAGGVREQAALAGTLARLPLYDAVASLKLDVTGFECAENAARLLALVAQAPPFLTKKS
ncbi:AAA family ATPase [Lacticaseibacillus kribbianus]|uniref:AAA family ATPase n=1 Tax=Lacticaseibacillus kribbianus TaxID=2926292 RepID=UPI001CD35185|nr:AAA family ATPase [Lacticaseibacillus kribbianus]